MNQDIRIIINADDFGLSEPCTHAIAEAFTKQLISSATMMANGPYFNEACKIALDMKVEHKIGIHLNLTEGMPVSEGIKSNPKFCDNNGNFHGKIRRFAPLNSNERSLVFNELAAQIEKLKFNGIPITHADSHHHIIHTALFISPIALSVLKKYDISKIRKHRNIGNINLPKKFIKFIYNTYLGTNGFLSPERFGGFDDLAFMGFDIQGRSLEIMVHPNFNGNGVLIDTMVYGAAPDGIELHKQVEALGVSRFYSYFDLWDSA